MGSDLRLSHFLNPSSVAVVGASESFGAWGHMILDCLVRSKYQGKLYPVNPRGGEILGVRAYPSLLEVPSEIELAVVAVPAEHLPKVLEECAAKKVKAGLLITAGFSEAVEGGKEQEAQMARFARENGMRLIGPNVSGIFDQSTGFYACPPMHLPVYPSEVTFLCQGGFAIYDLLRRGHTDHKGVGKMIHTGNEADLKLTDFLELVGDDESSRVILLHIEGLRDGRRFVDVAKKVSRRKPIIAFKAGGTQEGSRAAASHTGAMAGSAPVYSGLFRQAGVIEAPQFEILLDMGYAFLTQPPLRGNRVCVITMGGSWGVMVVDALARHGLRIPEPSERLQKRMRGQGFPVRASTRNPIDFGAAGAGFPPETRAALVRDLAESGEFDALLLHGFCMAARVTEQSPPGQRAFVQFHKAFLTEATKICKERGVVALPVSHMTGHESQIYEEIAAAGIPVYHRADDAAAVLSALGRHYARTAER